jgi:hypothetical protein
MSRIAVRDRFGDTWKLDGEVWRQIGVVLTDDPDESIESAQETNRRIVTCWNEHDDLVKERDELVAALRRYRKSDWGSELDVDAILAKYPEAS